MVLTAIYKDDAGGVPHYMGLTGKYLSLAVSIVATNGFLLFGYDQGVMSGIISAEPFADIFPEVRDDSTWQGKSRQGSTPTVSQPQLTVLLFVERLCYCYLRDRLSPRSYLPAVLW